MKELMKKMLEQLATINNVESKDETIEEIEKYAERTMELSAKVNWKYFTFLKEEGFTEEQAMQMVLAGQRND